MLQMPFKPRAQILLQLGEQLIKNENIAILELVKNAYDADAKKVVVNMRSIDSKDIGYIEIRDDGCGMSIDIIRDIWMEPGNSHKKGVVERKAVSYTHLYFEEASGADPDRKEFNRLKQEISQDQIDVVVSVRAAMIARDWGQFMEFMEICEKAQVEVLCLDEVEDAGRIFQRIQKFIAAYFEGSEET